MLPYPPTTSFTSSTSTPPLARLLLCTSRRPHECPDLRVIHLLTEVRLDNAVILPNCRRRSLGDLLAVIEDAHRAAGLHHDLQDVLDDDHGEAEALLQREHRVEHNLDIDGRQPGSRLVEHQELRSH